jgi:hypothetical protein
MYLTVQQVRSHRGESGINGAAYVHHANHGHALWNPPVLPNIVNSNLGKQIIARVDVAPGGNTVEAFLDVVGPDDLEDDDLREVLANMGARLTSPRVLYQSGEVAVEFFYDLGLASSADALFQRLCDAALELRARPAGDWMLHEPLVIFVSHEGDAWLFRMEDESRRRLREYFGEQTTVGNVRVPFDVADHFRFAYGELYPFAVEWVTSKPRHKLLPLGGVRFLEKKTIVWEWPQRNERTVAG